MSTVFLSGSRRLSRLNEAIRARLKNMVDSGMDIIIGDANGADRAMQEYLARTAYQNVTVYCAGDKCRNNVGNWASRFVKVDSRLRGRDFYAKKDKAMAALADFGLVLWDGKSVGSINNVYELVVREKKVVVYYSPDHKFCTITSKEQLQDLLARCDPETLGAIKRECSMLLESKTSPSQASMAFDQ
jgi:hypothetical protein